VLKFEFFVKMSPHIIAPRNSNPRSQGMATLTLTKPLDMLSKEAEERVKKSYARRGWISKDKAQMSAL
jgi:hypothetical protein